MKSHRLVLHLLPSEFRGSYEFLKLGTHVLFLPIFTHCQFSVTSRHVRAKLFTIIPFRILFSMSIGVTRAGSEHTSLLTKHLAEAREVSSERSLSVYLGSAPREDSLFLAAYFAV